MDPWTIIKLTSAVLVGLGGACTGAAGMDTGTIFLTGELSTGGAFPSGPWMGLRSMIRACLGGDAEGGSTDRRF